MNYQTDVCIIGAGPGGALLAYLLAKQNISTILIERSDELGKEFRGEHLNEDGEMILKKHHIFEEIESLGLLRMSRVEYWKDGHVFKTIESELGHAGIHGPQQHLLQSINNQASIHLSYKLMLGTKVTELMQNEKGQYTGIKAQQKGRGEIIVESKIIIGADGRYSTVRKLAHIKNNIHNHGYDLLWAKIPAPANWEPSIKFSLVKQQQVALFSQAKGFVQISISEVWSKHHLLLLGDAAHTMTPTGAFGLNESLKDADLLSDLLHQVFYQNKKISETLRQFEQKRKPELITLERIQFQREKEFSSHFISS